LEGLDTLEATRIPVKELAWAELHNKPFATVASMGNIPSKIKV
jgi:hypothetical protein